MGLETGMAVGRYTIGDMVSKGGTATVFRGHVTEQLDLPPVAIKVVDLSGGYEEAANEAELLMELDHPGLPRVYEKFEYEGSLIFIEDLIVGETLEAHVESSGPLPEAEVIGYGLQLASILLYLHDRPRKVIHRDLKPSNIILSEHGPVLVDFGIAKVYQPGKDHDTVYAYTQRYASPEQLLNRGTDERSDVYSFGATLAYLATGVPTPPALGQLSAEGHTITIKDASPDNLRSSVSPGLKALILRCMEFDPEKRYQDFRGIATALKRVGRGLPPDAWRLRPWMVGATGIVLAITLATAVWWLWPRTESGGMIVPPPLVRAVPSITITDKVALGQPISVKLEWSKTPDNAASVQWTVKDLVDASRALQISTGPTATFTPASPGRYSFEAVYDGKTYSAESGVYPDFSLPAEAVKGTYVKLAPTQHVAARKGIKYTWLIKSPTGGNDRVTSDTGAATFATNETGVYQVTLQTSVSVGESTATYETNPKVVSVFDIPIPTEDQAVNQNPSFELYDSRGPVVWSVVSPSDTSLDATTAFRGDRSLRVSASDPTETVKAMQQVLVQRGTRYRAQVWVRGKQTSGPDPKMQIWFRSRTSDTFVASDVSVSEPWPGSYDWSRLVVEFTTPSQVDTTLEIRLSYTGKGTVWFDYCIVEQIR